MRHVTFVDFVELEFEGNVMSKALIMGDVDNDGRNEIALGTTNGDLYLYKGIQNTKPWAKASNLGMIACLEVGDLFNRGINCLVSLGTEGWCHIFCLNNNNNLLPNQAFNLSDIGQEIRVLSSNVGNPTNISNTSSNEQQQQPRQHHHQPLQHSASFPLNSSTQQQQQQQQQQQKMHILNPAHTQRLSSNCKACVIADIDGDGKNELIVAFTDRVVRCFKWLPEVPAAGATNTHSTASLGSVVAGSGAVKPSATTSSGSLQQSSSGAGLQGMNYAFGALVLVEKWKLAGQVGSMTTNRKWNGRTEVLVSQPGGSYVVLVCSADDNDAGNNNNNNIGDGADASSNKTSSGTSLCYHPLGSARARNPNVTTEIISNLRRNTRNQGCAGSGDGGASNDTGGYSAICTLDGTLTLIVDDTIAWSLYVDHQLFSLTKMDITGDGTEEVVACSWDGHTYIVNLSKEVVRFHFKDNVAAFTSGTYHDSNGRATTTLCYATFLNKLVVYYNIYLSNIGMCDLISKVRSDGEVMEALKKRNVDVTDKSALKAYLSQLLYNPTTTSTTTTTTTTTAAAATTTATTTASATTTATTTAAATATTTTATTTATTTTATTTTATTITTATTTTAAATATTTTTTSTTS